MKLLGCALNGLLIFSIVSSGIVLYDKGSLNSVGGFVTWAFLSLVVFVVFALLMSPILLIITLIGKLIGK
jgi:hypothetical protein